MSEHYRGCPENPTETNDLTLATLNMTSCCLRSLGTKQTSAQIKQNEIRELWQGSAIARLIAGGEKEQQSQATDWMQDFEGGRERHWLLTTAAAVQESEILECALSFPEVVALIYNPHAWIVATAATFHRLHHHGEWKSSAGD